jgi:nitroreductase
MCKPQDPLEVFHRRQCHRDFASTPIAAAELERIFAAAQRAPSSKNTQPWKLHLVQGDAMERLRAQYLQAFAAGEKGRPDYGYSIEPLPDEWKGRARQVGFALFAHKQIAKGDEAAMQAHYRQNYGFFGAPHTLFISLPAGAQPGNFLDCGLYAQSFMLALTAEGYGSCPMFSAVHYPDLLRQLIPGTEGRVFLVGIAFGKPLPTKVNEFYTERSPLSDYLQIIE